MCVLGAGVHHVLCMALTALLHSGTKGGSSIAGYVPVLWKIGAALNVTGVKHCAFDKKCCLLEVILVLTLVSFYSIEVIRRDRIDIMFPDARVSSSCSPLQMIHLQNNKDSIHQATP